MLKNLADLFDYLDANLAASVREEIAALPKQRLIDMHFGLNAHIRSLAFYRNDSPEGKSYFSELGSADEASGVLGDMYSLHVRGEKITEEFVSNAIERHGILYTESEQQSKAKELVESYERFAC
jgi:hypothetical protein